MTSEEAKEILEEVKVIDDSIYQYNAKYLEALEIAIKALEQEQTLWISINDKLPEMGVNVLADVIGVGIRYQRVMWIDNYTGEWVGFAGNGYKDRVIAWQPLPDPCSTCRSTNCVWMGERDTHKKCEDYQALEQEPKIDILDKIIAEIDAARYIDKDTKLCKNANASGLEVAMQIIDKYRQGVSE